jgi:lipopolysaccharide export system protein LptA
MGMSQYPCPEERTGGMFNRSHAWLGHSHVRLDHSHVRIDHSHGRLGLGCVAEERTMSVSKSRGNAPNGTRRRAVRSWVSPTAKLFALLSACVGVQEAVGQTWDTKRGIAGLPLGQNGVSLPISQNGAMAGANALNARWMYTWGNNPPADVLSNTFNGEYTPMIWSANTSTYQATVDRILGYATALNVKYVMGFNEPERTGQANMSVANAITIWNGFDHQFAAANIKLVSPGVSDDTTGRAWLADFMTQADALNLTVDAVAFHWYGTPNLSNPTATANGFLSRVDYYWNTYQRPVWVTEFAGMDWGNTIPTPQLIAWNAEFLRVAVAGLESRSYVERYSWWQYGMDNSPEAPDDTKLIDVVNGVYTPTVIGDGYVPSYGTGTTLDLKDKTPAKTVFYMKGGSLINSTGAPFVTARSVDAISGTSTFGGDANWDIQNGFLRVRSGATLTKIGTGQVTLANLTLENSGTITVSAGVLELGQNLNFTSSTGTYRASGGTLLITGNVSAMGNPIVIQSGGTVIMDSVNAGSMTSPFDVQAGGTLQIGRTNSFTNVFPNSPTVLTNNGTVIVYHNELVTNMTGGGTLVAELEEVQVRSNPGFTGAISVTNGQLAPQDATAFGTAAGITTVQGGTGATGNITLRSGISTGAEPITLVARQGAAVNAAHILSTVGTNTLAGNLTLLTGGFDYNLQSDLGLLVVSGNIVSSPNFNTRNFKLLGTGAGLFSGNLAMTAGATNTLIKNGTGTWTVTGSVSAVGSIQVLQGQLALAGPVAATTATVSSGAELAITGTGSANNISRLSGAGTVSFSGNSTNTLSGTFSMTGRLSVASAQLTLANLRLANTGEVLISSGLLELGQNLTYSSNSATFRVAGGTLLVTGNATGMANPIIIQSGGTAIIDSANGSAMGSTFDVQPGGTLQIGRITSNTNIFPDAPAGITNNGTIIVFDTETVTNMTGAGTLVAELEETQALGNPAFTGAISVTNGQLVLRDSTGFGTAAGITTVQGNLATGNITLRDGVSTGAEPITLVGRQGTAINSAHILNSGSTNTVAGSLTLADGGSDYNFRSDTGTLTIAGGIITSPNSGTRNLKLLGTGTGVFSGAITLNPGATNTLVKNGTGPWTLSGAVSGVSELQVLQGRLTLSGPVAGGTVAVSSGAELAIVGSGSASSIAGFGGAGTISFSGNSTNALSGIVSMTGRLSINSALVSLAPSQGSSHLAVATVGALSVLSNARLIVPAHTGPLSSVVVTSQISVVSGTLDLANNDLIVRNGDIPSLISMLLDGRLTSSMSSPGSAPYTTLGLVANGESGLPLFASFDNIAVNVADALIKYTYLGDTDLSGTLDATDFNAVLSGFTNNLTGWQNGDVNHDGVVNATDWSLFAPAYIWYASFGTPLGGGGGGEGGGGGNGGSSIPEPASLGLLAAIAPLMSRRRR